MKKILFECHHLYYLPNFSPVIDELKFREGFDISISIPCGMSEFEKNGIKKAAQKFEVQYIDGFNEGDRRNNLRKEGFDAVIVGNVGSMEDIVSNDTIAVMIYHGIGLKQTYYRDRSDRIDIRAVESEERFSVLKDLGSKNIYLTGFTKLDPLFRGEYNRKDILIELGLDTNRKTIIYAPTFYPSAIDKVLPELEILSSLMNVIVKLHQFSWHQSRYRHHGELVRRSAQKYPGIILIERESFNILPYFAGSDLLISDISSTIYEFLPVNKPILLNEFYSLRLKHRIFRKRFNRKLDFERLEDIDFVQWASKPEDLGLLVMEALENPDEMQQFRSNAVRKHLFKSDGKASSRLIDVLEEKLQTGRT